MCVCVLEPRRQVHYDSLVLRKLLRNRGHEHKSWVSIVAFDPYATSVEESDLLMEFTGNDEDFQDFSSFW